MQREQRIGGLETSKVEPLKSTINATKHVVTFVPLVLPLYPGSFGPPSFAPPHLGAGGGLGVWVGKELFLACRHAFPKLLSSRRVHSSIDSSTRSLIAFSSRTIITQLSRRVNPASSPPPPFLLAPTQHHPNSISISHLSFIHPFSSPCPITHRHSYLSPYLPQPFTPHQRIPTRARPASTTPLIVLSPPTSNLSLYTNLYHPDTARCHPSLNLGTPRVHCTVIDCTPYPRQSRADTISKKRRLSLPYPS